MSCLQTAEKRPQIESMTFEVIANNAHMRGMVVTLDSLLLRTRDLLMTVVGGVQH